MINSNFYNGFEGEGQVIFSDEVKNELIVWEGYIYVLMERMFEQGYKILVDFYNHNYEDDENPWTIPDIPNAINQYKSFNVSYAEEDNFKNDFPKLIDEITRFLMNALASGKKVYMQRD
jgi:hypothetical protein